jgi:hypothetical protein
VLKLLQRLEVLAHPTGLVLHRYKAECCSTLRWCRNNVTCGSCGMPIPKSLPYTISILSPLSGPKWPDQLLTSIARFASSTLVAHGQNNYQRNLMTQETRAECQTRHPFRQPAKYLNQKSDRVSANSKRGLPAALTATPGAISPQPQPSTASAYSTAKLSCATAAISASPQQTRRPQ